MKTKTITKCDIAEFGCCEIVKSLSSAEELKNLCEFLKTTCDEKIKEIEDKDKEIGRLNKCYFELHTQYGALLNQLKIEKEEKENESKRTYKYTITN